MGPLQPVEVVRGGVEAEYSKGPADDPDTCWGRVLEMWGCMLGMRGHMLDTNMRVWDAGRCVGDVGTRPGVVDCD